MIIHNFPTKVNIFLHNYVFCNKTINFLLSDVLIGRINFIGTLPCLYILFYRGIGIYVNRVSTAEAAVAETARSIRNNFFQIFYT